jgi:hypothetical protein
MQVKSLRDKLKKQFGVLISKDEIALALNAFAPWHDPAKIRLTSPLSDQEEAGVIEVLVKQAKLPIEALCIDGHVSVESGPKSGKAKRSRRKPGSSLVHTPDEQRPKSAADEADLEWMRAVIAADKAIKQEELAGRPYRPRWELTPGGKGGIYPDPFSDFLDPSEFSRFVPVGTDHNEIYASYEKIKLWGDNPEQSYQWRSNELIRKFEAKLLGLWCAKRHCRQCNQPLEGGMWEEVKQLLRGERYLPETPNVSPSRLLVYPEFHPWCISLRMEMMQLEYQLQDMAGDSTEAVAFRTAEYVNLASRVAYKHEADGVKSTTVIQALRDTLRVDEERSKHAA